MAMLENRNPFRQLLAGLTYLRPTVLAQSLLFPWRRAYRLARLRNQAGTWRSFWQAWRAVRAARPPDWDSLPWTFVGDVRSCDVASGHVTLYCTNAAIRLAILAPDLVQVRLSRAGAFPAPFSYAVSKPEDVWPLSPFQVEDGDEALQVRTGRLVIRVARRPCRLAFLDPDGQEIQADAEGLGWCGQAVVASRLLTAEEHLYGLGAKATGLDRRGHAFEMWNTDPQAYPPGRDPLYLNIPFLLGLRGTRSYGLFFDNSYRAHFDLGARQARVLRFAAAGGEMRYYFFYGPDLRTVLERYTELTGRMPLPPLWALGYHQSRWSYYPEARVREVARQLRARNIPCDAIHLDIDYMHGYRCFTWDPRRFPDPRGLVGDLRGAGFKTVAILDPAIKADGEFEVFRKGQEQGAFCSYPDGTLFRGPVWPGDACFPDFTSPRVREWWASLCHDLWSEIGIAGIWNDMNEPAVFAGGRTETVPDEVLHDLEGRGGIHAEAHNVYGMQMARATREGWRAWRGAERPFVITRAGFAGVQRYAACWTGDNQSTWEHLRLTPAMLLGLGLSGLAFSGCDTGGFAGAPDGEMFVRWMQLGALTPYLRNHTALATPPQEPWAFGEPYEGLIRAAIELRYRLLPYLYTAFWQCAERGLPIIRALCFDFQEDAETHPLDDQFLCGDALLVAPVLWRGATSRPVYFPAGAWYHLTTGRRYDGPATAIVDAPLEELPLFARGGSVVPAWPAMQHVGQRPVATLTLHLFAGSGSGTGWLYEDDGRSVDYQRGVYRVTRFDLSEGPGGLELRRQAQGTHQPEYRRSRLILRGVEICPREVLVDGQPVSGWTFDRDAEMLEMHLGEFRQVVFRR